MRAATATATVVGAAPLPPWAATLSHGERMLVHWYERALYLLMFAIPLSGLALAASGDDGYLGLNIATHFTFFVVVWSTSGLCSSTSSSTATGCCAR